MPREHVRWWIGEAATSLALAVLGLGFALLSRGMGLFEDGVPGPGMAPLALGIGLAALGLAIAAKAVLARSGALVAVLEPETMIAVGLMLAAVLAFERLGYAASSFLFLWASFVLIGREPWLPAALFAGTATILSWALFVKALGVGLPAGILALP